jgi:hypothetical protein
MLMIDSDNYFAIFSTQSDEFAKPIRRAPVGIQTRWFHLTASTLLLGANDPVTHGCFRQSYSTRARMSGPLIVIHPTSHCCLLFYPACEKKSRQTDFAKRLVRSSRR